MKLYCPHCGVKGSAEDSYSGRKVKCPKCQAVFKVKPDMAVEPPEDATLLSALSSTPTKSPDLAGEVEMPIAAGEGFGETGVDEVLSVEEEELLEIDGDFTEPEPETTPPAEQEEMLDWDDIASEIDLQLAEGETGEEQEKTLDGDPANLSSFPDEFEKPAGDFNLTEESTLLDPVDSGSPEQEIENDLAESVEIAESYKESITEDEAPLVEEADEIELEPYGIDKEQCWQCGKIDSIGEPFIAKDGRLYCTDCIPLEDLEETADTNQQQDAEDTLYAQGLSVGDTGFADDATDGSYNAFTVGDAIRKAWAKTKDAKGAIWAGSAIMYLVLLVIVAGGAFLLPSPGSDLTNVTGLVSSILLQSVTNVFAVLFTTGLLLMGIRKVAGDQISWQMIFKGFSCAGKIITATVLQSLLVSIGFLLLILPGIYLAVGYAMTLPLIVDKGLSPWQAMEVSRKAVHKIWWKVSGLFVIMGLIFVASLIPLGIGLIWTWPMFIILAGVVYQHLFGDEKRTNPRTARG